MVNQIIQPIISDLKNLSFADRVFGVVQPLQVNFPDGKGQGGVIEKTFPIASNDYDNNCNSNSIYLDCVPNSKYKSLIYFENDGWTVVSEHNGRQDVTATLRMVCWCNLKLIDKTIKNINPVMANILSIIPKQMQNNSPYTFIRLFQKQVITDVQIIFGKYSYDEAERVYYIYPYGCFAVDYEMMFKYNSDCVEPIILDPDSCL